MATDWAENVRQGGHIASFPIRGAVVFAGILLLAAAASGQNPFPSGNLYGTVLDEDGNSVSGVGVFLRGPGAPQTATTDRLGDFHFLNLSPGDYAVALERTGFETLRREVTVALGEDAVLAITMAVAGAAEAVTVSADSRKIETGETFNRKELDTIPTTRDPWAILRQVPCVQLANVNVDGKASAVQSVFVGKGAHVDQNTYNLDGVAITGPGGETPLYFDFDSMQAISVVTGGSDPEIATPGVTLNLVTRRGTNDLRGSGRAFYFFPGNWDYGLEAGGPLWKDHLWLWAARAGNNILGQTVLLPDGEPFRPEIDLQQWNAKLNAQIVPANELSLFYLHFDKVWDGRQAGPSFSFPSSWKQTTPSSAYRVEDSQVLSERLFVSFYGSYLKNNFTLAPEGGVTQQADQNGDGVWQNSFLFYNEHHYQHQAGLTASGFFDTGKFSHELKFGFGYKHTRTDSLSVWPGNQLIGIESSDPSSPSLAAVTRAGRLRVEWNYYDVYGGDTIQAGNLTVNLGLRFDHQQTKSLPSAVSANPVFPELLPAVQYGGYAITWKLVQPRVGATYALGQQKKTLVRASYSKFTDQLGEVINSVNPLSPAYLYYSWSDTNGDHRVEPNEVDLSNLMYSNNVDPDNPGSAVSLNRISSNLKPAETNEFLIGIGRQFSWDFSASITYTHRSAKNQYFPGFPDAARPIVGVTRDDYQYAGNAVGTATASDGFTLSFNEPYYGLATCPSPCAGVVVENRPDYSMRYDGVELQVDKPLSHGWGMRVGFAYNDWTQTVGSGAIVNPNNLRGGVNRSGAVIEPVFSEGAQRSAGSFINSKWQFNLRGSVQLPLGITAAANLFGRQGFPIGYFVRVVTIDARGRDTIPLQIGPVDANRNPNVYDLDLHIEELFRIGKAFTINPSLDCFNVANRHTVLQRTGLVGTYDATGDTPTFRRFDGFNAPAEQMTGRTFRAGVRVSF